MHFIPISALKGDNVVEKKGSMPWYHGAPLLEYLENVYIASDRNLIDLRLPVQYVLRPDLNFRGFAGQLASGVVKKGDSVRVLPSGTVSKVKSIVTFGGETGYAFAPQSVNITLEDEVDISRGDMLVHPHNIPHCQRHFEAMVVWMNEQPLDPSREYLVKHTARMTRARIDELLYKINVNTLHREAAADLKLNEIGRAVFTSRSPLFFDPYSKNRATGSFIIIDVISNSTVGAGMILDSEPETAMPSRITSQEKKKVSARQPRTSLVSPEERARKMGHRPATVWLTGLVSSGKKEIAARLEKLLFDLGSVCVVLDGSTVRSGLSSELDFSAADRAEHLRRAAEICRILNDSGIMAICAFVSPSSSIRDQISKIVGDDRFIEVFVDAPLEWCEKNDMTGLYIQARKDAVNDLPGVSVPYERPSEPRLTLHPEKDGFEKCAALLCDYLKSSGMLTV
jgi:adenylyl-sulfate kinase